MNRRGFLTSLLGAGLSQVEPFKGTAFSFLGGIFRPRVEIYAFQLKGLYLPGAELAGEWTRRLSDEEIEAFCSAQGTNAGSFHLFECVEEPLWKHSS